MKLWLVLASLALLIAAGVTLTSCDNSDDPEKKAATANFTFVVNPDNSGSVVFTNTSVDGKEYLWNFDDGTQSTEASPTHDFAESGTYTVSLTALGDAGTTPSVKTQDVEVIVEAPKALEANFDADEEDEWTIVGTGADKLPKVEFGVTANVPQGGSGGALRISNPDTFGPDDKVEMVMYREVELEAGKEYTISALIKHGPLTLTDVEDGGPKEAFVSIEFSDLPPTGTGQWKNSKGEDTHVLLHRYCVCWWGTDMAGGNNGSWLNSYTVSWIKYLTGDPADLTFSVETSGTYYIGFKAGLKDTEGATFSSDGFVIDKLVISE